MSAEADFQSLVARAEQGDANYQFRLAVHYLTDTVAGPQPKMAYEWARRAAQANHEDAKKLLAKSGVWHNSVIGHAPKQVWFAPVLTGLLGLGAIMLLLWVLSPTASNSPVAAPPHAQEKAGIAVAPADPQTQGFGATPHSSPMPIPGATVQYLRLFESGVNPPEQGLRAYSTRFIAGETRYIFWEIGLAYPAVTQPATFRLHAIWYDDAGNILREDRDLDFEVESGWTHSFHFHGFGNANAGGYWKPGNYRVGISYAQDFLAQQTFTVVDETLGTTPPPAAVEIPPDPAIGQTLSQWAAALATNDIPAEVSFYDSTVDPYFRLHNVSRQFIESDKQKLFDSGIRLTSYHIRDLLVTMISRDEAVVVLIKDWQTREGAENAKSTRSRLHLRRLNDEWKIVGEQDLLPNN